MLLQVDRDWREREKDQFVQLLYRMDGQNRRTFQELAHFFDGQERARARRFVFLQTTETGTELDRGHLEQ